MRRLPVVLILFVFIAGGCTAYHAQGTGAGAAVGAISGAVLDPANPWRGAVIGGTLGGILGASMADIAMKASMEAAQTKKTVVYKTEDGRGVYRADPVDYNAHTKCTKVRERIWENGQLKKDRVKEICKGRKEESGY